MRHRVALVSEIYDGLSIQVHPRGKNLSIAAIAEQLQLNRTIVRNSLESAQFPNYAEPPVRSHADSIKTKALPPVRRDGFARTLVQALLP